MDKNFYMREAAKFCRDDQAFIHVEMDNYPVEIMISGGGISLLHCLNGVIYRISKIMRQSYQETVTAMFSLCKDGRKIIDNGLGLGEKEVTDLKEIIKREVAEEINKEFEKGVEDLAEKNKRLVDEISRLENVIQILKIEKQNLDKSKSKQIRDLTKEIQKLEHENDRLANQIMFGGE